MSSLQVVHTGSGYWQMRRWRYLARSDFRSTGVYEADGMVDYEIAASTNQIFHSRTHLGGISDGLSSKQLQYQFGRHCELTPGSHSRCHLRKGMRTQTAARRTSRETGDYGAWRRKRARKAKLEADADAALWVVWAVAI